MLANLSAKYIWTGFVATNCWFGLKAIHTEIESQIGKWLFQEGLQERTGTPIRRLVFSRTPGCNCGDCNQLHHLEIRRRRTITPPPLQSRSTSLPPTDRQLAVSLFGNMIGKMRNTYEQCNCNCGDCNELHHLEICRRAITPPPLQSRIQINVTDQSCKISQIWKIYPSKEIL